MSIAIVQYANNVKISVFLWPKKSGIIFIDFDEVISHITAQNKKWHNLGRVSTADKNIIYQFITKKWYER